MASAMNSDDEDIFIQKLNGLEIDSIFKYSEFYQREDGNSTINIFHYNIRCYSKNVDQLSVYNNSISNVDIVVLTECWLSGGEGAATLEGFDLYHTTTYLNQNDGVIVYVNKLLSATTTEIKSGAVYGIVLQKVSYACCLQNIWLYCRNFLKLSRDLCK